MPRVRHRGYVKRAAAVQKRYASKFAMLKLTAENFHEQMPEPEERLAFAEAYPERFLTMFEFVASYGDKYPNTATTAAGANVFRRPVEFFEKLTPRVPFDPPDLRSAPYREKYQTMAQARRDWWTANKLPMTEAERSWAPDRPKKQEFSTMKGTTL